MDAYLFLGEDNSVRGYFPNQPEGMNFPRVIIKEEDLEEFKANFYDYKYDNGKLVKIVDPQESIEKLKQTIQTQQTMLSNSIQTQAKIQMQFNSAVQMNSKFMQQISDLQVQIKKLQEAK